MYGPNTFAGIEVKSSDRIRPEDLRPLRAFLSEYPEAKGLFLYRGKERRLVHDILCLPCEDFLRGLKPNEPIELTA